MSKFAQRPAEASEGAVWLRVQANLWLGAANPGVVGEVGLKGHSVKVEVYGPIPSVEGPTGPQQVLEKVVEPPLERECRHTCDQFVAVGGKQAELHDEEEEDQPLQRKLNRDEGLALATRLLDVAGGEAGLGWGSVLRRETRAQGQRVAKRACALVAGVQCGELTQKQRQRSNQVQHKMLLIAPDLPGVTVVTEYRLLQLAGAPQGKVYILRPVCLRR